MNVNFNRPAEALGAGSDSRAGWMLASALVVLCGELVDAQKPPLEPWVAPTRASKKANPEHSDANSLDVGQRIYERECLSCHGAKGLGDGPKAADLERRPGNLAGAAMWDQTDGALFWKISEGRAPMPATKTLLSEDERWHVINYVRTLAPIEAAPSPAKFAMPDPHRKAVSAVIRAYEAVRAGLVEKVDAAAAANAVPALADAAATLATVDAASIPEAAKNGWLEDAAACARCVEALKSSGQDVARLRAALATLSTALTSAIERYGHSEAGPIFVFAWVPSGGQELTWIQLDAKPGDPYGAGGDTGQLTPKRRLGGKQK